MNTLKLTRKDFDASLRYIANEGILDHDGHVEIQASLGYVSFIRLTAKGYIVAQAGTGIEAGAGIEAGWYVRCKLVLAFNLRLFAGLCLWRLPNAEEMEVRCGKKEGGTVVHGNLIETGLPEEPKVASFSGKKVSVTVDGQTYTATID